MFNMNKNKNIKVSSIKNNGLTNTANTYQIILNALLTIPISFSCITLPIK